MIHRHLTPRLLDALADTPVVFLTGARQTGKSTLARLMAARRPLAESPQRSARYVTFDDASMLAAASADPAGFLAGFPGPVVLDEVQRVPGLFLAIKAAVDTDRVPGRYLLTGSSSVLMLPRLAEALVGRMEVLTLWPFAQAELEAQNPVGETAKAPACVVDLWFSTAQLPPCRGEGLPAILPRILAGGYPEAVQRESGPRRHAWFGSYLTTILQRDVRDLAQIEGLSEMPRLLALLATRVGGLANFSELSRSSGLAQTTLKRYTALLEGTYLLQMLPAWSTNLSKRLVKSPKLFLTDTGLMAHLLGWGTRGLPFPEGEPQNGPLSPVLGPLVEAFVVQELRKQSSWSETQPQLYHLRAQTGQEVDLVLEDARGRLVGVEVKASATVGMSDFKGLRFLHDQVGERLVRGLVLYAGHQVVPFGPHLHAVPLESLWQGPEGHF